MYSMGFSKIVSWTELTSLTACATDNNKGDNITSEEAHFSNSKLSWFIHLVSSKIKRPHIIATIISHKNNNEPFTFITHHYARFPIINQIFLSTSLIIK